MRQRNTSRNKILKTTSAPYTGLKHTYTPLLILVIGGFSSLIFNEIYLSKESQFQVTKAQKT